MCTHHKSEPFTGTRRQKSDVFLTKKHLFLICRSFMCNNNNLRFLPAVCNRQRPLVARASLRAAGGFPGRKLRRGFPVWSAPVLPAGCLNWIPVTSLFTRTRDTVDAEHTKPEPGSWGVRLRPGCSEAAAATGWRFESQKEPAESRSCWAELWPAEEIHVSPRRGTDPVEAGRTWVEAA